MKNTKGITLIALVITIIVLLILAGISISMLSGDNSIIQKGAEARERTKFSEKEEQGVLGGYEVTIENSMINEDEENVWYKIDGEILYLNNSKKDDSYKKVKKSFYVWNEEGKSVFHGNINEWVGSTIKKVIIENKIAPKYTSCWFLGCTKLREIENIELLDTSNVINMESMFDRCEILEYVDVSHFNTHKVTDMRRMFAICSKLNNIDVSNFDTSNVTNLGLMFHSCANLESIDVSNFDTSKATKMDSMFK